MRAARIAGTDRLFPRSTSGRLLLRDDADPTLAGELLRLVLRGADVERRAYGVQPSPVLGAIVRELYAASHNTAVPHSGSPGDASSTLDWVTVDQAAEVLGCSVRWVRALVSSGRLAAQRTGRAWRVDVTSLDDYRHGRTA